LLNLLQKEFFSAPSLAAGISGFVGSFLRFDRERYAKGL